MKDFLISTDTTADLPDNYVKENNIDIHTLFYAFGEVIYGTEAPVRIQTAGDS